MLKIRKSLDESFINTLQVGKPYALELLLRSADGKNKWVRTNGRAETKDGKVIRVYGNIIDITEHKEIENDLARTKSILQVAMDQSQAGIIIVMHHFGESRYLNKCRLKYSWH